MFRTMALYWFSIYFLLSNAQASTEVHANSSTKTSRMFVGGYQTCLYGNKGLKCFGNNRFGQISVPDEVRQHHEKVSGSAHSCAIVGEEVICWGYNGFGQTSPPKDLHRPRSIAVGRSHSCVISGRRVRCWGNNKYGQTDVPKYLFNPKRLTAGDHHTCAETDFGIQCWGRNLEGQLKVPKFIRYVKQLALGLRFSCALSFRGQVKCWGAKSKPFAVPKNLGVVESISAENDHICALSDGRIRCWGTVHKLGPLNLPPEMNRDFTEVQTGTIHACGLNGDMIRCWGSDYFGQSSLKKKIGRF